MKEDLEDQENELLALESIFSPEEFVPVRGGSGSAGQMCVSVSLPEGFSVAMREGDEMRQYGISFLPPLILTFDLPEDYPSSSPPSFTLFCDWLTHTQLSSVCVELVVQYQATGGSVVLFSWIQFLREDLLPFLGIRSVLELPAAEPNTPTACDPDGSRPAGQNPIKPEGASSQGVEPDQTGPTSLAAEHARNIQTSGRAHADHSAPESHCGQPSGPEAGAGASEGGGAGPFAGPPAGSEVVLRRLQRLLQFDRAQRERAFAAQMLECGVCLAVQPGSDCVRLEGCGHVFCSDCLSRFCADLIAEGNVKGISCPQPDCDITPSPAQVRKLVGEELFDRYDRLLLQSTLDSMSDVVYCPRTSCSVPVLLDASSRAALCPGCHFAFCVSCRRGYHGAEGCRTGRRREKVEKVEDRVYAELPHSEAGLLEIWHDYSGGSRERRKLLESRYGRHNLHSDLPDFLSEDWKTTNTKACPHCSWLIQKNGGCNMMSCSKCHQGFCWNCLTKLTGRGSSQHFHNPTNPDCLLYY